MQIQSDNPSLTLNKLQKCQVNRWKSKSYDPPPLNVVNLFLFFQHNLLIVFIGFIQGPKTFRVTCHLWYMLPIRDVVFLTPESRNYLRGYFKTYPTFLNNVQHSLQTVVVSLKVFWSEFGLTVDIHRHFSCGRLLLSE